MARVTFFDHLQTRSDTIAHGALYSGTVVFIRDIALVPNDRLGLEIYKLKQKVPEFLQGHVPDVIEGGTCEDYHKKAIGLGLDYNMHQVFPLQNFPVDFDSVEIGSHHWQPKLDVLTARFDALDLVNALDQELVDEFVAQLSAGGDAFALIDAKVLVETQRATTAEGVVSSGLAQEVSDRDAADVILQSAIDAVQSDVDQNEQDADSAINSEQVRAVAKEDEIVADLAQEVSDRGAADGILQSAIDAVQSDVDQNEQDADSAINAEEVRAVAKEDEIAVDLAQEIVDRGTAVTGEASARAQAISQEVSDRDAAIATAVADLINSAPGALDTLKDLADALGNDDEFSVTLTGLINAKQNQLTHGIADGNTLKVVGSASSGDFPRFTLTGLEPRSLAGFKSDLTLVKADVSLGSVEDTALSTWAGSSVVSALGNVTTGEWKATAVADAYVASAATWNAKQDDLTVHEQSVVDAQPFTTAYKQDVDDNKDKISYSTSASDQVAANVSAIAGKQEQLTHGIADGNTLKVHGAGAAAGHHVRFTASGLESRSLSNYKTDLTLVKADVGLGSVEDTTLSTWAGSTNILQVGNVASGQWQGTAVADAYVASAATWNAKQDDLTPSEQAVVNAEPFTAAYKQDVDDNKAKISYSSAASTQVAANVLAIAENTSKVGYTEALVSANSDVADNSAKVSYTGAAQVAANVATIATKAADSVVIKKTGVQSITQNGSSAVLTLTNTNGDQSQLDCVGGDGTISLSGGNVLTCDRPGGMYIRSSDGNSNIQIQSQGSTKVQFDDKVRVKQDLVLEKTAPGSEGASGEVGTIRVSATHIYVCTAADTWKTVALGTF